MQPGSQTATDAELLDRSRRGDSSAFGAIYDRYLDSIYRYVVFRVSDIALAEDITATTFIRTWESIIQKGTRVRNVRPWLFRTAHNLIVDHYRTHKKNAPLEEAYQYRDDSPSPEAQVQGDLEYQRLASAVQNLSLEYQQVITSRFVSGLSHAETAEIMRLSVGHVRVLQHRALRQLREALGEDWRI